MGIDIEAGPLAGPPQDGISMVSYSIPHVSKAVLVANHCWPSPGSTSIHGKSLLGYPMGSPGSRVVEWTFASLILYVFLVGSTASRRFRGRRFYPMGLWNLKTSLGAMLGYG